MLYKMKNANISTQDNRSVANDQTPHARTAANARTHDAQSPDGHAFGNPPAQSDRAAEPSPIYLDHAAATPLRPCALAAMRPYFSERFYNPSSPYLPAQSVRDAYRAAKDDLAHTIGAKGINLTITSGATEANNLAFSILGPDDDCLILATEHDSVRRLAKNHYEKSQNAHAAKNASQESRRESSAQTTASVALAQNPHSEDPAQNSRAAEAPYEIAVDKNGLINLADLEQKLTPRTKLVSISIVNNELGTIQPLNKITALLNRERARRRAAGNPTPLFLHTDASQALNLLDLSVRRLGADLITLSSAKLGGPKGVGALYASPEARPFLKPLIIGGGQENDLRSGTENVPGVVGFAAAAIDVKKHLSSSRKRYETYKQIFKRELLEQLKAAAPENRELSENLKAAAPETPKPPQVPETLEVRKAPEPLFLGSEKHQLANFCPLSFPGLDAERLVFLLESAGVYVSTGAACAASKGEKSHVLKACGFGDDVIAGSLRVVFGATNDEAQIVAAAEKIAAAVKKELERLENA